jgi:hypothetical protein
MDLLAHHVQRSLASTAMCVHGPVSAPGRERQADLMERGDRELEDPLAAVQMRWPHDVCDGGRGGAQARSPGR